MSDETYIPPAAGWTCFHCGERFAITSAGRKRAEEHFGPTPDWTPACIERRTIDDTGLLRLSRQARRDALDMLTRAQLAEQGEEIAHLQARSARDDLDRACAELRHTVRDLEARLALIRRLDETVWRAAWDALVGGEPYPLVAETEGASA